MEAKKEAERVAAERIAVEAVTAPEEILEVKPILQTVPVEGKEIVESTTVDEVNFFQL